MRNEEWAPPGVDPTKVSVARFYDYMLGGKDNFAVDREAAERSLQIDPNGWKAARWCRVFLRQVVHYLAAEARIDQYIDIGSGLPTQGNVHDVAGAVNPSSRVVYVDSDPMVLAHGRALLANARTTTVIQADARCPEQVLNCAEVARFIDFSKPVALLMFGIMHHFNDHEKPAGIVAGYRKALPSGSYLALSHFRNPGAAHPVAAAKALQIEKLFLDTMGSGRFRTHAEILEYFGDFDLIEPGIVPFPEWRPGECDDEYEPLADLHPMMVGGVGRKH